MTETELIAELCDKFPDSPYRVAHPNYRRRPMNFRSKQSNSDLRPPKKRKPFRTEGKVTNRVRLYGPERTKLRENVYLRAKGFCERKLQGCSGYTPWKAGHLSHIRGVGAGGADTEENTLWSCASCHGKSHNCDGKPCPPKPKAL